MLASMKAPRLSAAATAVAAASALFVAGFFSCGASCGGSEVWLCLNPVTGKEDASVYDANHYVNGVLDPCHCYDPGGPSKSCPYEVDAGPDAAMGDAGADAH
jgi:hypothetical protein